MSFAFSPQQGLIIVSTTIVGPAGNAVLRLALDTGATTTLVNISRLQLLGYDTQSILPSLQIVTGSGTELASEITLGRLSALGMDRTDFPVICHSLPPAVGVDGLLGLDFLRGRILTVDFQKGEIDLA